jgi:acetyltransferase-like isoleucine patch superfamily enzyme
MGLRELARRLVYGSKDSSETYVEHLRSLGMVIGDNTVIYSPTHCIIDATRPWMIEIGHNVSITEGVTILTHGYDWSVFKGKYGDVLGSAGHVRIGDNVFIGAGSVVTKSIPSDSVAVGDPCCVIGDINSYLEKRRAA